MSKKKATKKARSARKLKRTARGALSVATSARRSVEERVTAMSQAPLAVCENDESLQAMLNVLRNKDEPVEVRRAALHSLAAAAFSVIAFESCRGDYIATLREVATDPDPMLRRRALGILSREQDGFAQKKLLEGLQDPEKALVPPEKALQLLSYDIHAEAYPIAREIVNNPPNTAAKREALRLLAADASAAPMFEKILRDKDESPEIRQVSAAALQAIRPEKLQAYAREAVLDPSEQDEIQATSLIALTQFGDAKALGEDEALKKRVDKLSGEASMKVKQSARRFLKKYSG
jgi:HEAT repeats